MVERIVFVGSLGVGRILTVVADAKYSRFVASCCGVESLAGPP